MQKSQSFFSKLGFTRNHLAVLAAGVFVLTILILPKSGLKVSAMFSQADEAPKEMITYEQARGEIYAQMEIGEEEKYLQDLDSQFALLDRGAANGAVLGEAIGIGAIPSAEQMLSRENLDLLPVKTTATSAETVQAYASYVAGVEAENDVLTILANLNSSDSQNLLSSQQRIATLVGQLGQATVPAELADFHRYKIIYYQTLSEIAEGFLTNTLDVNFQNASKLFLSITDKIEQTKAELQKKYSVTL
jgi:hypothetical protein